MTFSREWDEKYSGGFSTGAEALVLKVVRLLQLNGKRVLELGSGNGCNIPPIIKEGAEYWGVEGSFLATDLSKNYNVTHGDFTESLPDGSFDAVIDRASLPHNSTEAIKRCIGMVNDRTKSGTVFFGADWFSVAHSEFHRGESVDEHTRTGYPDGQFVGIGRVHFFDAQELTSLFDGWSIWAYQHRITELGPMMTRPPWTRSSEAFVETYRSAVWDFIMVKR